MRKRVDSVGKISVSDTEIAITGRDIFAYFQPDYQDENKRCILVTVRTYTPSPLRNKNKV